MIIMITIIVKIIKLNVEDVDNCSVVVKEFKNSISVVRINEYVSVVALENFDITASKEINKIS